MGGYTSVPVPFGSKFVAVGYEGDQLFAYAEGQAWGSGQTYWEVQVVREGESFNGGMQFIGIVDDRVNLGAKLFVVGRING